MTRHPEPHAPLLRCLRPNAQFDAPAQTTDDWLLDLGDVRESARVRLNGRDGATAWRLPFEVRLGDALRPGRNILEIEVATSPPIASATMDRRGVAWKFMPPDTGERF